MPRYHLTSARSLFAAVSLSAALLAGCAGLDVNGKGAAANAAAAQAAADQAGAPTRLAQAARDAGDYRAAEEIYKQMLVKNPADTDAMLLQAATQLESGMIYDAIDSYGKIPANSPASMEAELGLERASLMLSQPADALGHAEKALTLAPHDARALIGRGVALDMLNRHVEAQASYQAALAQSPHDVGAISNLALSLAMTRNYDQAIRILTPLVRAPSATARLRQNLALIYGLKGDVSSARALNRVDLDAAATEENLKFYAVARKQSVR